MPDLLLQEDPRLSIGGTMAVSPGTRGATLVTPNQEARRVIDIASYLDAGAALVESKVRYLFHTRPGEPAGEAWPAEAAHRFMNLVHALVTITELHNRHHANLASQPPIRGRALLEGREGNALRAAKNIYQQLTNDPEFMRNPSARANPRRYGRLVDAAEALANLMQGDTVTVRWERDAQRGLLGGQPPDTDGTRRDTVNLDRAIDDMVRTNDSTAQAHVFGVLADAMSNVCAALQRSPRLEQAAHIAEEAFSDDSSLIRKILTGVRANVLAVDNGAKLAIGLLQIDAVYTVARIGTSGASATSRMRRILDCFQDYANLDPADAVGRTNRQNLQAIFNRLQRDAQHGSTTLTSAEARQVRSMIRLRIRDARAYTGALLILNWVGFVLSATRPPPLATTTTLGHVAYWGGLVSSGLSASDGLAKFIGLEPLMSRSLVQTQSVALRGITSGSGMITAFGAVVSIAMAASTIEQGLDENNDVLVVVGSLQMAAGALQVVALAFPPLQAIAAPASAVTALIRFGYDAWDATLPENFQLAREICRRAIAVKGPGEQPVAELLGLKEALQSWMNDHRPFGPESAMWRPLCRLPPTASRPGDPGAVDNDTIAPRPPSGVHVVTFPDASFADEARQRLELALGNSAAMQQQIQKVLWGDRGRP